MRFSMPTSWAAQVEKWTEERGVEWRASLDNFLANRGNFRDPIDDQDSSRRRRGRPQVRVVEWTAERFYEIIHLWNDQGRTAVEITRWWISQEVVPAKDDSNKGIFDGTAHRGAVDGMIRRMQRHRILNHRSTYTEERIRAAVEGKKTAADGSTHPRQMTRRMPPTNRFAAILEQRRKRVQDSGGAFEKLSREERGMPPAELAHEQHPDHPSGVTHDAAFRMQHGRTNLFSLADRNRLSVSRRFGDIVSGLTRVLSMDQPTVADYTTLRFREKDMLHHSVRKILPRVKALVEFLESIPQPEPDTVIIEDQLRIVIDGDQ